MMRYRFVDEVVTLELGEAPRIEIRKTFDVADDALTGPDGPRVVPSSLVLELLAMAGGHLVFRHLGSRRLPLLLKVPELRIDCLPRPGIGVSARARLRGVSDMGDGISVAETEGEVQQAGAPVASGRCLYVCVTVPGVELTAYGLSA